MKKIISIFLLVTIFFTLTACGNKTNESTENNNEHVAPVIEERTCRLTYNNEITGRTNVLFKILSKGYFVRPKDNKVIISVGEDEYQKMTMKNPENNSETTTYTMYSNCNIENAKATFMITGKDIDVIKDIASKITIEKWSNNENKSVEK